ncbi:Uncharacterised protein [Cedecea neteri]|uniref:Uncharacterized protein n=1 Tax=Cedecea neteri TaxID=158822 RepID=A0A2X2V8V1_9ENTR|nr:Uncharacterised protein [Cedecea neteri]
MLISPMATAFIMTIAMTKRLSAGSAARTKPGTASWKTGVEVLMNVRTSSTVNASSWMTMSGACRTTTVNPARFPCRQTGFKAFRQGVVHQPFIKLVADVR